MVNERSILLDARNKLKADFERVEKTKEEEVAAAVAKAKAEVRVLRRLHTVVLVLLSACLCVAGLCVAGLCVCVCVCVYVCVYGCALCSSSHLGVVTGGPAVRRAAGTGQPHAGTTEGGAAEDRPLLVVSPQAHAVAAKWSTFLTVSALRDCHTQRATHAGKLPGGRV